MENTTEKINKSFYIIKVGSNFVSKFDHRPHREILEFSLTNNKEDAQRFVQADEHHSPEAIQSMKESLVTALHYTGGEAVRVDIEAKVTTTYTLSKVVFRGDRVHIETSNEEVK